MLWESSTGKQCTHNANPNHANDSISQTAYPAEPCQHTRTPQQPCHSRWSQCHAPHTPAGRQKHQLNNLTSSSAGCQTSSTLSNIVSAAAGPLNTKSVQYRPKRLRPEPGRCKLKPMAMQTESTQGSAGSCGNQGKQHQMAFFTNPYPEQGTHERALTVLSSSLGGNPSSWPLLMALIRVDLPAPLGPHRPYRLPLFRCRRALFSRILPPAGNKMDTKLSAS